MVKEDKNVERNLRKTKQGKVVSNKMDKTIVVAIDDKVKDPLYNKIKNKTLINGINNNFTQEGILCKKELPVL